MAKKVNSTGKISSGNRKKINIAKEERRQALFAKRREEGKGYEYKPNPYPKDSDEYNQERRRRAEKNMSQKTPVAKMRSVMAKLDNYLNEQNKKVKELKEKKSKRKIVAA